LGKASASEDDFWFYQFQGLQKGPVRKKSLLQALKEEGGQDSGIITKMTMVWNRHFLKNWSPLGEALLLDLLTLNNDTERRTFILKEIVETETNYVEELAMLVEHFVIPLKNNPNILKPHEWQKMFGNIESILMINQFFLGALNLKLQSQIKDPIHSCLGDVFSKFMDKFKTYSDYTINHQKATLLLSELRTRKNDASVRFKKFVNEEETKCNIALNGTGLAGLLISPVQRVIRYKMLLIEFLKYTEKDHLDHTALATALEEIKWVASDINEAVRQEEEYTRLKALEKQFTKIPDIAKMKRKQIFYGKMEKQCRKSVVEYDFWLFNDLLVYAEERTVDNKFVLHKKINIDGAFAVNDVESVDRCSLDIVNSTRSFRVYIKNNDEKKLWMEAFEEVMKKERTINLPPGPHGLIFSGKDVAQVVPGSHAENVGIRPGWTILKVNSQITNDENKILKQIERTASQGKETIIIFQYKSEGEKAKPVWTRDEDRETCPQCDRRFTISFRKHHCRGCGSLVCSKCSESRHKLHEDDPKPVRVCQPCYADLSQNKRDRIQSRRRVGLFGVHIRG